MFTLKSDYSPAGDQVNAIRLLKDGVNQNKRNQLLVGITGSGKTFTMANIIRETGRPTMIMAHNKTLAAQLYQEMKELFPENAVEYFVSYYDYYQPESYIPRTDTFIEKDASINEQIDLLRHSATRSLLERRDVIVVASVSAIYGIGSPDLYYEMTMMVRVNNNYDQSEILSKLVELQYQRNDVDFKTGTFRVRGSTIDIFPPHYSDKAWRLSFEDNVLQNIYEFDPLTGKKLFHLEQAVVFGNSHFITPKHVLEKAIPQIRNDLALRLKALRDADKLVEAQRLETRTKQDLEFLITTGHCKGIENYSRYFSNAKEGDPPATLFHYLPEDALLFVDESHVTVPQIKGMYNGDRARKTILVEHGFRLPSALDNRPLKFEEWDVYRPCTIFVSATPSSFEIDISQNTVEQIIRPTGLLDPLCVVKPAINQVEDLIVEIDAVIAIGSRVLVTALTKKMAEDLNEYLLERNFKSSYLHCDVYTLERTEIIKQLRRGEIDVLIGINLLREGLDIPECSLVAILDADKGGFLRSEVSLIQTIGRAARNSNGRVILYADFVTNAMKTAMNETARRRKIQEEHNTKNGIVPTTIMKTVRDSVQVKKEQYVDDVNHEVFESVADIEKTIVKLKKEMIGYANKQDFEKAAEIRDRIKSLLLKLQ